LALEVNDKRQNVTYETSEFKLSNRTLPALKEFLTNQGFAKVAKAISDYVDHKPRIENLIFSTIEESCYKRFEWKSRRCNLFYDDITYHPDIFLLSSLPLSFVIELEIAVWYLRGYKKTYVVSTNHKT